MTSVKLKMVSKLIKERRKNLNITQLELAELSNISLRTIQRIEKGEVAPRMFTLKSLANSLDFSLDFLNENIKESKDMDLIAVIKKIGVSLFSIIIILMLATAYIAQSNLFPETEFEFWMFSASIVMVLFVVQIFIWQNIFLNRVTLNSREY